MTKIEVDKISKMFNDLETATDNLDNVKDIYDTLNRGYVNGGILCVNCVDDDCDLPALTLGKNTTKLLLETLITEYENAINNLNKTLSNIKIVIEED